MALAEDGDGMLWAGTSDGAHSFSDGRWISHPVFAPRDLILAIAYLWIGTDVGLTRYQL